MRLLAEARQMGIAVDELIELIAPPGPGHANCRGRREAMIVERTAWSQVEGAIAPVWTYRRARGVNLEVPRGVVFGLVGENGAGKTTLIKHLLGLLKAQTGTVRVFGLDPVREPVSVLARIGYLSEDRDLPDWMRLTK